MVESVDGSKGTAGASHRFTTLDDDLQAVSLTSANPCERVRMRPAQRSWKIDIMVFTRTCSQAI
jgi:hypothetical protein